MKYLYVIAVLGIIVIASNVLIHRPKNQPSPPSQYKLLPLGDSYTIGEGAEPQYSWPALLVNRLKRHDVDISLPQNPAVSGYTTQELINEELALVATTHPTHVTIMIGANDIVQGVDEDVFARNIQFIMDTVLETVEANRITVITIPNFLLTPTGSRFTSSTITTARINLFNTRILEAARRRNLTTVDLYELSSKLATDSAMIAPDGLHPSARQYARWADTIYPMIRDQF